MTHIEQTLFHNACLILKSTCAMRNSTGVLCQEICLLKIAATLTFDNMWAQRQSPPGYQIIGIIH